MSDMGDESRLEVQRLNARLAQRRAADSAPVARPECYHDDGPAVAVEVFLGQGEHLGSYLCWAHAKCSESGCSKRGDQRDSEYGEAWCRQHADQFTGEEAVVGPDIVSLDSDRYRRLVVEHEHAAKQHELNRLNAIKVKANAAAISRFSPEPEEPTERTANQIWLKLDLTQRRELVRWFTEAYDAGWRPNIHPTGMAAEIYEITKTLGDR